LGRQIDFPRSADAQGIHEGQRLVQGVARTAGKGRDTLRQILHLRTEAEKILSVSTPTANALIQDFAKRGILTETTGRMRGRIWVFQRYLSLFVG